jgi:hypothetical protein
VTAGAYALGFHLLLLVGKKDVLDDVKPLHPSEQGDKETLHYREKTTSRKKKAFAKSVWGELGFVPPALRRRHKGLLVIRGQGVAQSRRERISLSTNRAGKHGKNNFKQIFYLEEGILLTASFKSMGKGNCLPCATFRIRSSKSIAPCQEDRNYFIFVYIYISLRKISVCICMMPSCPRIMSTN